MTKKITKTEKIFKELLDSAKQVKDENTLIYVSDTISQYIRKNIVEKIRSEIAVLIDDKELGIISEEQFEAETSVLRIVYKSLGVNA